MGKMMIILHKWWSCWVSFPKNSLKDAPNIKSISHLIVNLKEFKACSNGPSMILWLQSKSIENI